MRRTIDLLLSHMFAFRGLYPLMLLLACGTDATEPSASSLAGTYTATQLVVTRTGLPAVNVLSAGGSVRLEISIAAVTSGTMTIPSGVLGNPATIVADLAGAVSTQAGVARFSFSDGLFLDDLGYTISGATLSAAGVSDGTQIQVQLLRQ